MDIKSLRERTGLSQSNFAEKFHLKVAALQAWEQGRNPCPEYVLFMAARILDMEERERGAAGPGCRLCIPGTDGGTAVDLADCELLPKVRDFNITDWVHASLSIGAECDIPVLYSPSRNTFATGMCAPVMYALRPGARDTEDEA